MGEHDLRDLVPAGRGGGGEVANLPAAAHGLCPAAPEWPDEGVAWVVGRFTDPHPDVGLEWGAVTPEAQRACAAALDAVKERTRGASYDDWHLFFRKVGMMTANAPTGPAFDMYVANAAETMGYTPVAALHESCAEFRKQRYFPKGFDLEQGLRPHIRRALAERRAVEQIARGNPLARKPRAEPTEAERARVRETGGAVRARMEELKAKEREEAQSRRERLPDVSLSPDQLAQHLRGQLLEFEKTLRLGPNGRIESLAGLVRSRLAGLEKKHSGERGFRDGERRFA